MSDLNKAVGAPLETPVMRHTPGPWRVWCEKNASGRITVLEVCETQRRDRHSHFASVERLWPESEANARLIAAAPELLAALQAILTIWDGCNDDDTPPAVVEARKVVARAVGAA